MTRDEMIAAVEELNGAPFDPKDRSQQAILFLIASIECGPNYNKINRTTGIPRSVCAEFGMVARGFPRYQNPLWVGHKIHDNGWDDPETGGLALIMDAMVLSGLMERV